MRDEFFVQYQSYCLDPNRKRCQPDFAVRLPQKSRRLMRTVVLASQKGGSGKSTLAIGVAIAAMADGHRVAMIDTDPQGTVSNWGRRRTVPEPYIHRLGSGIELERPLLAFRQTGFTLAII